jgi:hypothetical protein
MCTITAAGVLRLSFLTHCRYRDPNEAGRPTSIAVDIANLTLRSLIFELRYPRAFYLWDRAGSIAAAAISKWPELKLREAALGHVNFRLGQRLELGIQIERSFAALAGTRIALDELLPFLTFLVEQVLAQLEVTSLDRVGFKVTFLKEYPSAEAAADEFFQTGLIKPMDGKNFGVDGRIDLPNLSIRFEGEHVGCTAVLQIRKRKMELGVPYIGEDVPDLPTMTAEHNELVFECDYFTTQRMSLGQFRVSRWAEEALHVIRRDSSVILGG